MKSHTHTPRGFSLIELMVVVAIIGILAKVTLSAYTSYIARANRAGARAQLMQVAVFMQRFYTANDSYEADRAGTAIANSAGVPASIVPGDLLHSPASGTALYDLNIPMNTATSACTSTNMLTDVACYTIRMVPVAGKSMANDKCGSFTLTSTGLRGIRVGTTDYTSGALRDECWK